MTVYNIRWRYFYYLIHERNVNLFRDNGSTLIKSDLEIS